LFSGLGALLIVVAFIYFHVVISQLQAWMLYALLAGALVTKGITGLAVVATISSYFKRYLSLARHGNQDRRISPHQVLETFDIVVMGGLLYATRSLVQALLNIELLPVVDWVFALPPPPWWASALAWAGYNPDLPFWANLDLLFANVYVGALGLLLVCWTLYRHGLDVVTRGAFAEGERTYPAFLVLGLVGGACVAVLARSTLAPLLEVGTKVGVVLGTLIYLWMDARRRNGWTRMDARRIKRRVGGPGLFAILLSVAIAGTLVTWVGYQWTPEAGLIIWFGSVWNYLKMRRWLLKSTSSAGRQ
jgi:hypothetical protein